MELGSPEKGALKHIPLVVAYITGRNKEDKNYFNKGGHYIS